MKHYVMIIGLTLLLIVSGCSTTTTRTHPSLEKELHQINTVVIIPPRVEIEYVTLTGENERMVKKEEQIRKEMIQIASERLKSQGYDVLSFDFEGAIESDKDFAYTITQVREGFERAKKDLKLGQAVSEDEAQKIQASVGEAVNIIADKSGADAIFLMRYSGFDKSGSHVAKDVSTSILVGVITMGAVVPVTQTSGAITEVALIDSITGEVIWAETKFGALNTQVCDQAMESLPRDVDPVSPQTQAP